jgi:predicted 3-demethylubiquinone-9 3-methyltransferase (glyoxalase superfamily)
MATVQKITPNLWFDGVAEEAANYYVSIFRNSKITTVSRYGKEGFEIHRQPEGTAMVIAFELEGQQFLGLNGGPQFKFSEAISFVVSCEDQEEIDYLWGRLNEGGDPNAQQCGWLKDKFGLSWQIIPSILPQLMTSPDKEKASRTMNAMLQMKKIDIEALKNA